MWISEKASQSRMHSGTEAGVGPVTIGGAEPAVLLSGENRGLRVLSPGGLQWQPKTGEQVMVLQTADGERLILGAVPEGGAALEDGELCLSCGSVRLKITADGIYITGALYLNGMPLTAGG